MNVRSAMKVPRYRWFLWAAFLAATLFFVFQMGFLPGGLKQAAPKGFELLDSLMRLVRNDYLEERDPVQTAEGAYRGLVNSLDPLSAYLSRDLAAKYLALNGRETGPGIVLLKRYAAFPQVVSVVDGSPADKIGIKLGDLLSAIGGRNSLSMSLAEANLLLLGADEQPVHVRVLRGNETLDLSVARALLFPEPFTFTREAGKPAGLRINRFAPDLVAGLRREVLPAIANKKTPLVLDLRRCHAGGLDAARELVNLFIKTADAGYFEKRGGVKQALACPAEPVLGGTPLVIWVDAGTMGPAELAAGLLQEVGKVKVVGFPTPGLVGRTEFFSLKDDSAILLTAGVFHLPSGRSLWEEGVRPDVTIPADGLNEKTYFEKTRPLLPLKF
jgi:carboxyl-terminal processing protease